MSSIPAALAATAHLMGSRGEFGDRPCMHCTGESGCGEGCDEYHCPSDSGACGQFRDGTAADNRYHIVDFATDNYFEGPVHDIDSFDGSCKRIAKTGQDGCDEEFAITDTISGGAYEPLTDEICNGRLPGSLKGYEPSAGLLYHGSLLPCGHCEQCLKPRSTGPETGLLSRNHVSGCHTVPCGSICEGAYDTDQWCEDLRAEAGCLTSGYVRLPGGCNNGLYHPVGWSCQADERSLPINMQGLKTVQHKVFFHALYGEEGCYLEGGEGAEGQEVSFNALGYMEPPVCVTGAPTFVQCGGEWPYENDRKLEISIRCAIGLKTTAVTTGWGSLMENVKISVMNPTASGGASRIGRTIEEDIELSPGNWADGINSKPLSFLPFLNCDTGAFEKRSIMLMSVTGGSSVLCSGEQAPCAKASTSCCSHGVDRELCAQGRCKCGEQGNNLSKTTYAYMGTINRDNETMDYQKIASLSVAWRMHGCPDDGCQDVAYCNTDPFEEGTVAASMYKNGISAFGPWEPLPIQGQEIRIACTHGSLHYEMHRIRPESFSLPLDPDDFQH